MKRYAMIALLVLAGCGSKTIVQDRPVRISVPIPAPCVSVRPAPVPSLQSVYPDEAWAEMDVRQKAAAVAENGVRLRTYGEQLAAATGACR